MTNAPDLTSRCILVTGAAGFIGFHLAQRLLAAGATVHGIDNLNSYYDVGLKRARLLRLNTNARFAFSALDITDYDGLRTLFAGFRPHCVVHLAAQAGVRYSLEVPRAYVSANVDGFLGVLEACRAHAVGHLLYASSSSVYGANSKVPFHEDDPVLAPVSLYGATKRANELMAEAYARLFAIPATGVRFFTVYGPWGRPDMAYYAFTRAILEGRPIDVFNQGRMQRDFTYIDDVTEALVRLIVMPPGAAGGGEARAKTQHALYNLGNHTPVELERFIAAIEAALGRKADRRFLPMQQGDVAATWADVERLRQATGFAPATSIEDGIARFVAWYRSYHGIG
jgi:UDP-glucuronate 4-epimerase